jgi:hypothetical protein
MTPSSIRKKILHKKAVHQTEILDVTKQKKIAEAHLDALLVKICLSVGIQLAEWEINKDLLLAVINNPKATKAQAQKQYVAYDSCYKLIKNLNVRVSSKYRWFTNIKEIIQQKN